MSLSSQLARLSAYLANNLVYAAPSIVPDCIYDDEPLGFENSPLKDNIKKIEVQILWKRSIWVMMMIKDRHLSVNYCRTISKVLL